MNYEKHPVMKAWEVMGGKWKPIILQYLNEAPRRSGELMRLIPEATVKMLTQQLREMERDGIVKRKVYHQVPPKVEYSLTPRGDSLRPIVLAMCEWAQPSPKAEIEKPSRPKRPASPAKAAPQGDTWFQDA